MGWKSDIHDEIVLGIVLGRNGTRRDYVYLKRRSAEMRRNKLIDSNLGTLEARVDLTVS